MIEISELKVDVDKQQEDLTVYIARELRIAKEQILSYEIKRRSVDARRKPKLYYVYTLLVDVGPLEQRFLSKKFPQIKVAKEVHYEIPTQGDVPLYKRPIVIGAGPAGLFAAYLLAKKGFRPIVLEQGMDVSKRKEVVETFWKTGFLQPDCNVQFGEGGAGTFSDGKLNTLVKDKVGRNHFVLETFVKFGAPPKILWDAKPHIGTDILCEVVSNLRKEIISLGGDVLFETKVTDFSFENNRLSAVVTNQGSIETNLCILAIGHSSRDTFRKLYSRDVEMSAKEFAVGFRIEHPQDMIGLSQYGKNYTSLEPAPYKLATKLANKRGVYSFCMCPGGYVINSSSSEGKLAINGMSYAARDSKNANSAIVISVGKEEYSMDNPLGAIAFQEDLERKAFHLGDGKIPQQLYADFILKKPSTSYGAYSTLTKGESILTDLNPLFSEPMRASLLEGMELFGHKIKGFDREDAIFSGIESRTSSPVRILRDDQFESSKKGLYPCGEGAGYAGGIMSAAMDGCKVAEAIISKYKVCYE